MSVWGYILTLFFIVGSGVAGGVVLHWQQLKSFWNKIASRTYVMVPPKNLIWHVFWFYIWPVWYWGKRRARSIWAWCKRFWASSIKNPAIVLLVIAWGFIALALWFFGGDIYDIYVELHKQIDEGGKTPEEYRGIAIRYFGIVAGAGAIIGYIFATGRSIISDNQNKINAQAQITESMVQAITQIGAINDGKPNIEVRLGGLYSLQRIMQDNPEQESAIARIFYAYVRENIKKDRDKRVEQHEVLDNETAKTNKELDENEEIEEEIEEEYLRLPEDVQAVLIIISQLNEEWRKQDITWLHDPQFNFSYTNFSNYFLTHLELRNTDLKHADFSYTDLHFADLSESSLGWANFVGAVLFNADLFNAHLANADFSNTNLFNVVLDNSNLRFANLSGADLREVCLENVDLREANLSGALLHGVDLSTARDLTQEQINVAEGNESTKLPKSLTHPEYWDKFPF